TPGSESGHTSSIVSSPRWTVRGWPHVAPAAASASSENEVPPPSKLPASFVATDVIETWLNAAARLPYATSIWLVPATVRSPPAASRYVAVPPTLCAPADEPLPGETTNVALSEPPGSTAAAEVPSALTTVQPSGHDGRDRDVVLRPGARVVE